MNLPPVCQIYKKPVLVDPSMLVCWHEDGGCLGIEVFNYLNNCLNMELIAEMDPGEYFAMSGVLVENDIAKFPEIKFYCSVQNNFIVLKSAVPRYEWYKYINGVLDIASGLNVKEMFTAGSMVSVAPHTSERELMASMNRAISRSYLKEYDINLDMDYETPDGQRPTMSTYMVWEALRKSITGVSLWVPVPFYLISVRDWTACNLVMQFLDKYLKLDIDFNQLSALIKEQDDVIYSIINNDPAIAGIIQKLENNASITESESNKLVSVMETGLKRGDFY